jgi:site-specific recombinase XerD
MQKTALYLSETKASHQSYSPVQNTTFDAGSTSQPHTTLPVALTIPELERHAQDWLFDGEYRNHAQTTIAGKRDVIKKLIWFLSTRQLQQCGVAELRQFLAYVANGHTDPNGRWGNPNLKKPVRPRTVKYYYVYLKGLFRWLVAEGILASSPLERLAPPIARSEQVQPFTQDQIASLLQAARNSVHPRRNEAILLILVDSGMRASELCNLRLNDVDLSARRATVLGKGNKHRTCKGRLKTSPEWRRKIRPLPRLA